MSSANAVDLTKSLFETLSLIRELKVPGTNRESQQQFSTEISRLEQALEAKSQPIFALLDQETMREAANQSTKIVVMTQLVKSIEEARSRPRNSLNVADTVSFWLSFQYSQKVRLVVARLLLECLHDSQEAQLVFCENQDNEGGINFTPSASSLIVLNVVVQNQHIFKDARSFNSFKKYCTALKADLESAPRPADARFNVSDQEGRRVSQAALSPPPKCWVYSLNEDSHESNQDMQRAKLSDLETQMVDPLDNLIGFYSVVGRTASLKEGSKSVISQGVASSSNARTSGVTSALCVRTSELSKNTTTTKKTVGKKVTNAHLMTSAGSGSESATMIKAFAQKIGPASSLIATSDASVSNRNQQQTLGGNGPEDLQQFNTVASGIARLSYPKGYNQMMQQTLQQKNQNRLNTMALSDHAAHVASNQLQQHHLGQGIRTSGNNSSMRQAANPSGLAQHHVGVAKTTKSSLHNTEKQQTSKLILSKGSAEKKVKSRAGSNNKQNTHQTLSGAANSVHSTKNASTFNKILERQQQQQLAAQQLKQTSSGAKFSQKKTSIKGGNSSTTVVPHLEMNKLMQGASLDKKSHGIHSIRNSTNRSNLGVVLAAQKDLNHHSRSGHGTPSSNNLNSQYALTAKKGKRQQMDVRRSSKTNQASNTMSAVSSDNQIAFQSSDGRIQNSDTRHSERKQQFMTVTSSQSNTQKVKTGKSVEFSPEDSSQGSRGAQVQSPYQIQNKLIHHVQGQYQTESHSNFLKQQTIPNEGSKSPEMVCSLKKMVTEQLAHTSKTSKVTKKKSSHLSNSHFATNSNLQSMGQTHMASESSAKQIQQIPKSQIKSIRHHQTLAGAVQSSQKHQSNVPASRQSLTGFSGDAKKTSSYNPTIQPLPTQKTKKLQIQMQFGQKPSSSSTQVTPASNITRPSTATQISYLKPRGASGGAQPMPHSTHTSPQNVLSTMGFKPVQMGHSKKQQD